MDTMLMKTPVPIVSAWDRSVLDLGDLQIEMPSCCEELPEELDDLDEVITPASYTESPFGSFEFDTLRPYWGFDTLRPPTNGALALTPEAVVEPETSRITDFLPSYWIDRPGAYADDYAKLTTTIHSILLANLPFAPLTSNRAVRTGANRTLWAKRWSNELYRGELQTNPEPWESRIMNDQGNVLRMLHVFGSRERWFDGNEANPTDADPNVPPEDQVSNLIYEAIKQLAVALWTEIVGDPEGSDSGSDTHPELDAYRNVEEARYQNYVAPCIRWAFWKAVLLYVMLVETPKKFILDQVVEVVMRVTTTHDHNNIFGSEFLGLEDAWDVFDNFLYFQVGNFPTGEWTNFTGPAFSNQLRAFSQLRHMDGFTIDEHHWRNLNDFLARLFQVQQSLRPTIDQQWWMDQGIRRIQSALSTSLHLHELREFLPLALVWLNGHCMRFMKTECSSNTLVINTEDWGVWFDHLRSIEQQTLHNIKSLPQDFVGCGDGPCGCMSTTEGPNCPNLLKQVHNLASACRWHIEKSRIDIIGKEAAQAPASPDCVVDAWLNSPEGQATLQTNISRENQNSRGNMVVRPDSEIKDILRQQKFRELTEQDVNYARFMESAIDEVLAPEGLEIEDEGRCLDERRTRSQKRHITQMRLNSALKQLYEAALSRARGKRDRSSTRWSTDRWWQCVAEELGVVYEHDDRTGRLKDKKRRAMVALSIWHSEDLLPGEKSPTWVGPRERYPMEGAGFAQFASITSGSSRGSSASNWWRNPR